MLKLCLDDYIVVLLSNKGIKLPVAPACKAIPKDLFPAVVVAIATPPVVAVNLSQIATVPPSLTLAI